jgi:uncharacterized protein involved in outer membrane biogenesis
MKRIKWVLLGVLILIVVGVGIVWLSLDSIVRRTVESQATDSLNLQTTLGGANVSLLGGNVSLSKLQVASPEGFSAPHMFSLGGIKVDTSFGELRGDPIAVQSIAIEQPQLVIEQANGKFNFQVLVNQQSKKSPDSGNPGDGQRQEGEPIRLIIHDLTVNDAQVLLRPGIPGLKEEIKLTIPSFALKDIGTAEGNKNGAAIKDVVQLLVTTLAQKASDSDQLPPEVKQLLSLNVDQIKQRVADEVNKQVGEIQKEIGKQLPGDIGKEAGKKLEEGIGGLLNQNRKPSTRPE